MKKKTAAETLENLKTELEKDFQRWEYLYTEGGTDPFYTDGVNLWLKRNHIIHGKHQIKEMCEANSLPFPEIYFRELPPEVSMDYMAKEAEIYKDAKKALDLIESNHKYISLKRLYTKLDSNGKQKVDNATGCLKRYIDNLKSENLVDKRRCLKNRYYLDGIFTDLQKGTEIAMLAIDSPVPYQMSLF